MDLVCTRCDATHPSAAQLCHCGGPLDAVRDLPPIPGDLVEGRGLGRFAPFVGLEATRTLVSLGEGDTPRVEAPAFDARLKLEYLQPTGSFKDRGACVLASVARDLDASHLVEDSSGNAGQAVAAYAARLGVPATIFCPAGADEAKVHRMEALGADVRRVEGSRGEVTEAAVRFCRDEGAYFANHVHPPWFLDGTRTLAYELADDPPDHVVCPCAMGTVLLGLRRGFGHLKRSGVVEETPRLHVGQAAGFAPVVEALGGPVPSERNTLPDGVLIPEPPRRDQLVDAVESTGGRGVALTEEEVRSAQRDLHRQGFLVEPTGAVGLAALRRLREMEALDGTVDVILTGALK